MSGGLAVVLSGGGSKGAFQVGVLDELINGYQVEFDLFVGVSTGAIQAAGGAMNDIDGLVEYWSKIERNEDIYLKKFGGILGKIKLVFNGLAALAGLAPLESIYDASPLRAKLDDYVSEAKIAAAQKKLRVGVASLQSGKFVAVDETTPNLARWVYASCSEPLLFEPLWSGPPKAVGPHEQWVDGGIRDITPLGVAMDAQPDKILVIRASPPAIMKTDPKRLRDLLEIARRSVDILSSEVSLNDLAQTDMINGFVAARNTLQTVLNALPALSPAERLAALAPISEAIKKFRCVPIEVIAPAPDLELSKPHEFDQGKIKTAMDAGRDYVLTNWDSKLKDFLT